MAAHALTELLRVQRVQLTASLDAERGVALPREPHVARGGRRSSSASSTATAPCCTCPPEKRLNLDFYKNNTIHFFLVPALLTRALLAGVPLGALRDDVALVARPLPLGVPAARARDASRATSSAGSRTTARRGAVVGRHGSIPTHPVMQVTCGHARELPRSLPGRRAHRSRRRRTWPITQAALVKQMQRQFATSLLLGEVTKPEGGTVVTFGNALARFAELGHVTIARSRRARASAGSSAVRPSTDCRT